MLTLIPNSVYYSIKRKVIELSISDKIIRSETGSCENRRRKLGSPCQIAVMQWMRGV